MIPSIGKSCEGLMKHNQIILLAMMALGFCACNKAQVSMPDETVVPGVYHLSLQATMDPRTRGVTFDGDGETITSQFSYSDKIYVYNKTQDALARHWDAEKNNYVATAITPAPGSISSSGLVCTLTGDLSFVKWDSGWETITPEYDDVYCLFYMMSEPDYDYLGLNYYPRFNYGEQNGSAASASAFDFAQATDVAMVVDGGSLTVSGVVNLTNLQSMFRQHLTFKNASDETVTPTITQLSVDSKNETVVWCFNPTWDESSLAKYVQASIDIDNPVITDGNIYLSLKCKYPDDASKVDTLVMTATDDQGNVYVGEKPVPEGGFVNGKYYHGEMELVLTSQSLAPEITKDGNPITLTDPDEYSFIPKAGKDVIDLVISGSSTGFCFNLEDVPATVTLTGNGIATYSGNHPFIYGEAAMTVVLGSNYTIICSGYEYALEAGTYYGGDLKLGTTGSTQTLTVTGNDEDRHALYGDSNYDRASSSVSNLAAEGFSVSRSEMTDNGDGTYTWVYTVSPVTP